MSRFSSFSSIAALPLALAACSGAADSPVSDNAVETAAPGTAPAAPLSFALTDGKGAQVGSVTITEDPNGATLKINAAGLPPGPHGVHLHEKGLCEGPKFESAGPHWNPEGKQHGRDNPAGAHRGDLANFDVPTTGSGTTNLLIPGVTMRGAGGLADGDGTSLMIHAEADDYRTDPSGASGDRVACAVLAPAGPGAP